MMTVLKIKRLIQIIEFSPASSGSVALNEKIFIEYRNWVLKCLKTHLRDEKTGSPGVAFRGFLEQSWDIVKGSCLSPTALIGSELMELLCCVAEYTAEALNQGITQEEERHCALGLLMPGVNLESIHEDYQDLQTFDVRDALEYFILGEGDYLLPISLLNTLKLTPEAFQVLFNPYFDYRTHEEMMSRVSRSELRRLLEHSDLTLSISSLFNRYHALCEDNKASLLNQLRQLCHHLNFNSVNGRGIEENAGSGTYAPILGFYEYWQQISPDAKKQIPPVLLREINKLLFLSSDPMVNINATIQLETCIASRREALISAMTNHEILLSQICIGKKQQALLLKEVIDDYAKAIKELITTLSKGDYPKGRDKLPITLRILEFFGVTASINSLSDLENITALSVADMNFLFSNKPLLRRQAIDKLQQLDIFIIFLRGLSPQKIVPFLKSCAQELTQSFLRSVRGVGEVLINLTPEKCGLFCEGLGVIFLQLICKNDRLNFDTILGYLNTEQQILVRASLPKLIHTVDDFIKIRSKCLNHVGQQALNDAMKDRLPEIIHTADDFRKILHCLRAAEIRELCNAMKDRWCCLIHTSNDLIVMLNCFCATGKQALFNLVRRKLPEIIHTANDLIAIRDCLGTAPEKEAVLGAVKDRLPELIHTTNDLITIRNYLDEVEQEELLEAVEDRLHEFIHTSDDFRRIVECLDAEKISELCGMLRGKLYVLVPRTSHFSAILKDCDSPKIMVLCEIMKGSLPELVPTFKDFKNMLLNYPRAEERTVLCKAMEGRLPKIIRRSQEFEEILGYLDSEGIMVFCNVLEKRLSKFIRTNDDLKRISEPLHINKKTILAQVVEELHVLSMPRKGCLFFCRSTNRVVPKYRQSGAEEYGWSSV